jgi:hypothetical protein
VVESWATLHVIKMNDSLSSHSEHWGAVMVYTALKVKVQDKIAKT